MEKNITLHCKHCGKPTSECEEFKKNFDPNPMTPNTQTIREWKEDFKKWHNEPYPASWKTHKVIEKIEEILSSHHSDLKQRVEEKITIKEPNDEIYEQWDLGYNQALRDVLTLLETNEK